MRDDVRRVDIGIGYTLATGRLFCRAPDFHAFAEALLDRPIYTHEFVGETLWTQLRERFENSQRELLARESMAREGGTDA